MKKLSACILTVLVLQICHPANGQLPANFPTLTVTTNYASALAAGNIFLGVNLPVTGVGYYAMIIGNDGTPVWYQALTNACWDFKVLPNGYLHYGQQIHALSYTGGGEVVHQVLDQNYQLAETIQAGNGYVAEAHDFQMLPNGNVLLLGYYLTPVDMSQVVPNGNPAALVSGAILQELDGQRNVVWQWRFWDHYPFTSQWVDSTAAIISEFHVNCLFLDTDGNLVVSTPQWVKKINRQTGDIMWHLGGTENQFTFVGVSAEQGISDFNSHDINRLPNGDVLLYNNNRFGQPNSTSSIKEYTLDETNKVATFVWGYSPSPGVAGPFQGSSQRLANGNTFIGWGGLPGITRAACTEVSGTNVVFEMKFDNTNVISYRSFRFPYPPQSQDIVVPVGEIASGNTYSFGAAGVSIGVQSGAGGYNTLTVTRSPYAPVYPLFQGTAPRVLPVRISLAQSSIASLGGNIDFDAPSLGYSNPTNLTVYYRETTGQGLFLPQTTVYNPVTGTLQVGVSFVAEGNDFGEFIFGYPDVADVSYPPLLNEVQTYRGVQPYDVIAPPLGTNGVTYQVNQQQPILLSWSPQGFARSYRVQISTNADFSNTVVSVSYQTDAFYVWNSTAPNLTYYYRVSTINDGGQSDWSTGSFSTVPPFINITFANGGEALQRGVSYFIRWNGNIPDDVNIELYKSGVFAGTIATNITNNGAYSWQPGFDIVPGSDYAIQITSITNAQFTSISSSTFSIIDAPTITPASFAMLPDNLIQFAISAPGATQVSVFSSTNLLTWQLLQALPVVNGSAVFTDTAPVSSSELFYRLRVP